MGEVVVIVHLRHHHHHHHYQFIRNLNDIAASKKKKLNSDKCRPIEEFIMWRNVDRKVALPPS